MNNAIKKSRSKHSEEITVQGTVSRVFYCQNGFFTGTVRTADGKTMRVCGPFVASENDAVILTGHIENNQYGEQLRVTRFEYDTQFDRAGIIRYITNNPAMKGIGAQRAKIIADYCGDHFDETVTNAPERLLAIHGMTREIVARLHDEWVSHKNMNKCMTLLAAYGLTHRQISVMIEKYGEATYSTLKANPYCVIDDVPSYGFKRADVIALKMGVPKDNPERIRAALLYEVSQALQDGDTWIDSEELISQANKILIMDTLNSKDIILRQLGEMLAAGTFIEYCNAGRLCVALPHIFRMELFIAERLKLLSDGNSKFDAEDAVAHIPAGLTECQKLAYEAAIHHKGVMIAGGAGVGKTHLINEIAKLYTASGYSVALAAPTGKAAKRIEQVVGMPAQTIHRMLRYDGREFKVCESTPLKCDVVIIDEMSMTDVPLFYHLLKAINLAHTNIILVGDHNQLPPVGPGNIIRDILSNRLIPTVILDQVVRQAGILKENSIAILVGKVAKMDKTADSEKSWFVVDAYRDQTEIHKFICAMYSSVLEEQLGYHLVNDVQLLAPMKNGILGVANLNITLQCLIQKKCYGITVEPVATGHRPRFYLHDKVIQTRNNYEIGVMNGSIGTIENIDTVNDRYTILFDEGEVIVEREDLRDVSLAYALTTHKAQGSEYPCVIAIVHKTQSYMHHRNLFYTAVTRARKTAIIVGDRWAIRNCASKTASNNRHTFLSIPAFSSEATA